MKVQILVDNPKSWIIPYAEMLLNLCKSRNLDVSLVLSHDDVEQGDILVLLSCVKKFLKLDLNQHNLVVHESYLPKGKGWSPLTWQILEGKNEIPITLFEATEEIDSGEIYFQVVIHFEGHELVDEIRQAQGETTIQLVMTFIERYPNISGKKQIGTSTFYCRRKKSDSKLDVNQSILSQFDLLRVVDNNQYPAFFELKGHTYKLSIEKID